MSGPHRGAAVTFRLRSSDVCRRCSASKVLTQNMRTFEVDEVVLESTGKQTAHRVICRGVRFLSSSQSATCQVSGVSRGSCSTLAELTAWQLHRSGPKTSKRLG